MPVTKFTDPDLKTIGEFTPGNGDIIAGNGSAWENVDGSGASDGDLLTIQADGTVAWEAAAGGGGGQTLVTRVVAASGGDHTTLGAAVTAASAGDTIWVTPGTYTESAITTSLANLTIIGANPESTVLNFTTNNLTPSGAYFTMRNIKMSFTTGTLECTSTQAEFSNVHYTKSGNGGSNIAGVESLVENCRFVSTQTDDITQLDINGNFSRISGNYFEFNASETTLTSGTIQIGGSFSMCTGNVFEYNASGAGTLVEFDGAEMIVSGNSFHGNASADLVSLDNTCTFSGNNLNIGKIALHMDASCNIVGNAFIGFDQCITLDNSKSTVTGNRFQGSFDQSTDKGIVISAGFDENTISGNNFNYMGTGVEVAASTCDNNHITGNHFNDDITTAISDSGTTTHIYGNSGSNTLISDQLMRYMKNTSGGALVAGDLVTFKAVAAGDEFTTTTTQGDDLVIGVVAESIANDAYGHIQTEGKVTTLKVDDTTDIAVGDFIGTFTTAGIGMKAASGDMAIAIALEAYTTDDSNGVIDALLISPRKI